MRAHRLPVTDSVTRDGETVVMVGDQVMLLSPMASAAWRLLADPLSVEELSERLAAEFGPPPEGSERAATATLLDGLVCVGLVEFGDGDG